MIQAWAAADVAAAERPLLDAGTDLMARAAWGLARHCATELRRVRGRVSGARVVLLVGTGNNGGDALHAGALLQRRGAGVCALLAGDRAHEGGLAALRGAGGHVLRLHGDHAGHAGQGEGHRLVSQADLVVDGILGIGGRGGLRGRAADLVTVEATAAGRPRPPAVVACDLPSGVDADTGAAAGPVLAADVTVTFGAAKPGLLLPPGDTLAGRVEVVDIGLDLTAAPPKVARWDAADAGAQWPWPWRSADKYARGVVGVVAGSPRYPGAGILATASAVAAGVGMARSAGDPDVAREVVRRSPEAVPDPLPGTGRVQAWLVGPGLPDDDGSRRLVGQVLDRLRADPGLPVVADAGAIVTLGRALAEGEVGGGGRVLLTPHAGELAALLGDGVARAVVEADPARHARAAARRTGATVLLKGATTVIATPDGAVSTATAAPAWLATAGSGDVLSGVAGMLLAAGLPPQRAGAVAAVVHGLAGQHAAGPVGGDGPVSAAALVEALPAAIRSLPRTSYEPDSM